MENHHPFFPRAPPSATRVHNLRRTSPQRDLRPGFQNGRNIVPNDPSQEPHQPRHSYRPKLAYRPPPIHMPLVDGPQNPYFQPPPPKVQPYTRGAVPYNMKPDRRLPPPGSYPKYPISLLTNGYATHQLVLLAPGSIHLANLLKIADTARRLYMDTAFEDIVEQALDRSNLIHISDGPSGGIWVVTPGNEEVVSCLMVDFAGGWEVLGIGKGAHENQIFMRHPCGFGPNVEEEVGTTNHEVNSDQARAMPRFTDNWSNSNERNASNQNPVHELPRMPFKPGGPETPATQHHTNQHQPHTRSPWITMPQQYFIQHRTTRNKTQHETKPKPASSTAERAKPDSYNTLLARFRGLMPSS